MYSHKSINRDCVLVYLLMKLLDVELRKFLWLYKKIPLVVKDN
jgi:hypothetical protein